MIYGILGAVGLSVCVLIIVLAMGSEYAEKAKHFDQMMTALVKDNQEIWRRFMESHNTEGAICDMNKNDISVNKSGCSDPTAYQAIKNMDKETQRVHRLVEALRAVCAVAGFEIEGRIALRDKQTDKVWR